MPRWIRSRVLPVLALLAAGACSNSNEPSDQLTISRAPVFARPSSLPTPSVASTTPSSGEQGEVQKNVVINGKGFVAGALVAWERGGLADSHITVHSATVVSASQINAVISIAPDADVTLYDVSVTNISPSERKKGIGTEVFEVRVKATGQAPTAAWSFPTADAGLALRGDGQFVSGGFSVYAHGVCAVETTMFPNATYDAVGTFDPAGDATIALNTWGPASKKGCVRKFTLVYPDGQSESLRSFNRVSQFANVQYAIPIGTTIRRKLIVNPSLANNVSRCDRLLFGPNLRDDGVLIGAGSDSVLVTRINARKWRVQSESAELSKALCEKTGELFKMPVDFTIEASADFPL